MTAPLNLDIDAATQSAYEAADEISKLLPAPMALGFDHQLLSSFKRAQRMAVLEQLLPLFTDDMMLGNGARAEVVKRSTLHTQAFWTPQIDGVAAEFQQQLANWAQQINDTLPQSLEHSIAQQTIIQSLKREALTPNTWSGKDFLNNLLAMSTQTPPLSENPVRDIFFATNETSANLVRLLSSIFKSHPYYLEQANKMGIDEVITTLCEDAEIAGMSSLSLISKDLYTAAREFAQSDEQYRNLFARANSALRSSGVFDRSVYQHLFQHNDLDNASLAADLFYPQLFNQPQIIEMARQMGNVVGSMVVKETRAEMKEIARVMKESNNVVEIETGSVGPVSASAVQDFRQATTPTPLARAHGQGSQP